MPVPSEADRIETPERVDLAVDLAGPGSRGLAVLVDSLILAGAVLVLALILLPLLAVNASLVLIIGIAVAFAMQWLYFALFEGLRDGQTPGKRALGLRVRKTGGYPIGWSEALIRNFLRIVDSFLGYGVGLLVIMLTERNQRLGDLAAGTVVVRERPWRAGGLEEIGYRDEAGAGSGLSAAELETVHAFLARRDGLAPGARERIAGELSRHLRAALTARGAMHGGLLVLSNEPFLEALAAGPRGRRPSGA